MKYFEVLSFAVLLGIAAPGASAASFNCRYAKLPVEVAVCQSRILGRLDERMARKYYRLKERAPYGAWREITREQKRWIRERNSCGYNEGCIEDAYYRRIDRLNLWLDRM